MDAALIDVLAAAGASCPELAAWCRCEVGRVDMCEKCGLGGPEICDANTIKALARRLAEATTKKL